MDTGELRRCIQDDESHTWCYDEKVDTKEVDGMLFFFNIFLNFILFLNFTILYWFCHISK